MTPSKKIAQRLPALAESSPDFAAGCGWWAVLILASTALLPAAAEQTSITHPAAPSALALSPEPGPAPIIALDETGFDFGAVPYDQSVVHRFTLSNRGQASLHVKNVQASCSCTSAQIEKAVLQPGETTGLAVTFTPGSTIGPVRRSILVTSDDPAHPALTLQIKATVLPAPPSAQPTVSFRQVDRAAQSRRSVRLPTHEGQAVSVKEIRLGGTPYLSVYPQSTGEAVMLEVVLDGSKLPDEISEGQTFFTVITESGAQASIPVCVNWGVSP